jgi:hypothetical protein
MESWDVVIGFLALAALFWLGSMYEVVLRIIMCAWGLAVAMVGIGSLVWAVDLLNLKTSSLLAIFETLLYLVIVLAVGAGAFYSAYRLIRTALTPWE